MRPAGEPGWASWAHCLAHRLDADDLPESAPEPVCLRPSPLVSVPAHRRLDADDLPESAPVPVVGPTAHAMLPALLDTVVPASAWAWLASVSAALVLLHWWRVEKREGVPTYGPAAATADDPLLRTHAIFAGVGRVAVSPGRGKLVVLDKRPPPALDGQRRPVLVFVHAAARPCSSTRSP